MLKGFFAIISFYLYIVVMFRLGSFRPSNISSISVLGTKPPPTPLLCEDTSKYVLFLKYALETTLFYYISLSVTKELKTLFSSHTTHLHPQLSSKN